MNPEMNEGPSEEVQDILTYSPGWILRWGILAITLVVVLMLAIAVFVSYPEVIESRITFTNLSPPASVISRSSGRILLSVSEGDTVGCGSLVGSVENAAYREDVLRLSAKLHEFSKKVTEGRIVGGYDIDERLNVGELQGDYSNFVQCYSELVSFARSRYYEDKIDAIEKQHSSCKQLDEKMKEGKSILERQVSLVARKYESDKALASKGLISMNELASSESAYLSQISSLGNCEANILSNGIQLKEYEKGILDLRQQSFEIRRARVVALEESMKKLFSQIAAWEQRYVLRSPIEGRVSFFRFWNNSQFVNAGNEIMVIVPHDNHVIGRMYLPQTGAGKTKQGQRVRIELDDYPYREFGIVYGEISSISPVSRENQYLVSVLLPNGFRTGYGTTLQFKNDMQGNAAIITEDLRLIERFFYQVRSLLKYSPQ